MKPRLPSLRADIEGFIAHRESRWSQLDTLLERVANNPGGGGRERVVELMRLYRLASSDLNQARAITANPELLSRLNQLVGRAYRVIYQAPPASTGMAASWRSQVGAFLMRIGPAAFQRQRTWVAIAGALLLAGALIGAIAVLVNPANGEAVIPREFFTQSPAERVEHIEASKERIDTAQKAAMFSSELYTHNIQVSFLVFALGALTVVGAGALLFYNGMLLGAIATLYYLDGVGTFFVAWVGPHGSLELPSIIFAGAAGMRLGHALHLPGEVGRAEALRRAAPDVCRMLGVCAITLVMAGLIEGSFSQFSSKSIPYPLKIAVAAGLFATLCTWLFVPRRGTAPA